MTQSLRIKENTYINKFAEKEKVAKELRQSGEQIRRLETEAKVLRETITDLSDSKLQSPSSKENTEKLETDNAFLKQKLKVVKDKLTKEKEANINLNGTIMMNKESKYSIPGSSDKDKKKFLSDTCCFEILNPEPPQGATVVCMDTYPAYVPVYVP